MNRSKIKNQKALSAWDKRAVLSRIEELQEWAQGNVDYLYDSWGRNDCNEESFTLPQITV